MLLWRTVCVCPVVCLPYAVKVIIKINMLPKKRQEEFYFISVIVKDSTSLEQPKPW